MQRVFVLDNEIMKANKYQNLVSHLKNVSIVSSSIIEHLDIENESLIDKNKLKKIVFLSALFHDIGKIDPHFQSFVNSLNNDVDYSNGVHIPDNDKKFSFENHPRHNEISWFILESLFSAKDLKLNNIEFKILKNAVLWHHAEPQRNQDVDSSFIVSSIKNNEQFFINLKIILDDIKDDIGVSFEYDDLKDIVNISNKKLPSYKENYTAAFNNSLSDVKDDINCEAITSIVRTVIITADRLVSAAKDDINVDYIVSSIFEENKYSKILNSIQNMENTFFPNSDRSLIQSQSAKSLSHVNSIAILNAPAGSGKTKVSLQWCKETNANKVYYIAPRTIICEELYDELTKKYLPKDVSIELITSDKKLRYSKNKEEQLTDEDSIFCSDINIMTLDQLTKVITTHKKINILLDVIKNHVIFDEFHEYSKLSGLDLLFAEIIAIKKIFSKSKTLLMSATPNYFMLEKFLNVYNPKSSRSSVINFETSNNDDFKIEIKEFNEFSEQINNDSLFVFNDNNYNLNTELLNSEVCTNDPFFQKQNSEQKTLVISNTATIAQLSYLINSNFENSLLAHSKYLKEDKNEILSKIKTNFGHINSGIKCLRSGPICQASLNITSHKLITELTNPENTLQRLGRLNRFAENFTGEFVIVVPYGIFELDKVKSSTLNLLAKNSEKESTIFWIKFLKEKLCNNNYVSNFKLKDIYQIYKEFYELDEVKKILENELLNSLSKSYKNIKINILNPMENFGKTKTKNKINLAKNSLRGQGYFAKMAVYNLNLENVLILENDYVSGINISKDIMLQYDSNYEYVKNSVKKQTMLYPVTSIPDKKIKRALEKAKKEDSDKYFNYVLDLSRSENFYIYTSFSQNHLDNMNAKENKNNSIVYLKTQKQPIGYIKLKKILN